MYSNFPFSKNKTNIFAEIYCPLPVYLLKNGFFLLKMSVHLIQSTIKFSIQLLERVIIVTLKFEINRILNILFH